MGPELGGDQAPLLEVNTEVWASIASSATVIAGSCHQVGN